MACLYDRSDIGRVAEQIIINKGYIITYYEELEVYLAQNSNGWRFRAETISALLGLIAVQEANPSMNSDERFSGDDFGDILKCIQTKRPDYVAVYEK